MVFVGIPAPLRIVLTTVVVDRPAAFVLVFGAAIADGVKASEIAIVIATRDLLPFMEHLFLMGFQLFTCEKGERIRHSPMDLRVRGRIPLWIVAISLRVF
jgi:hypothetical protein